MADCFESTLTDSQIIQSENTDNSTIDCANSEFTSSQLSRDLDESWHDATGTSLYLPDGDRTFVEMNNSSDIEVNFRLPNQSESPLHPDIDLSATQPTEPVLTSSCCLLCDQCDTDQMIGCDSCGGWIHFYCSDLPKYHLHKLKTTDGTYICTKCTDFPDDFLPNWESSHSPSTVSDPKLPSVSIISVSTQTPLVATASTATQIEPCDIVINKTTEINALPGSGETFGPTTFQVFRDEITKHIGTTFRALESSMLDKIVNCKTENLALSIQLVDTKLAEKSKHCVALERQISEGKKELKKANYELQLLNSKTCSCDAPKLQMELNDSLSKKSSHRFLMSTTLQKSV
jgi:hypothetical protein